MRFLMLLAALAATPAYAFTPTPDWPCIQGRQPHLSLGQVWTGPPPPESAQETPEIAALADRVAQRRLPIEEATATLDAFAQGKDADTLATLMQAIFQRIPDTTCGQIIHRRFRLSSCLCCCICCCL